MTDESYWDQSKNPTAKKPKGSTSKIVSRETKDSDPDLFRPSIRLAAGEFHEIVKAAARALRDTEKDHLFLHAGRLVLIARVRVPRRRPEDPQFIPAFLPLSPVMLKAALCRSASFMAFNARAETWTAKDCPKDVALFIHDSAQALDCAEPIRGISLSPLIRPDGSLVLKAGFDRATGVYVFEPPPLPEPPATEAYARAALQRLKDLLDGFAWGGEAPAVSRSVALALILTAVVRASISGAVPLFLITSPQSGSGKTCLAELACLISTGDLPYPVIAAPDPEETEKRHISSLLSGDPFQLLDNYNATIGGDVLTQAVSGDNIAVRPLGRSEKTKIANSFLHVITGNNPRIGADIVRRQLTCRIDHSLEEPWKRSYEFDPRTRVRQNRATVLSDALAIVAWARRANLPAPDFQGFGEWARDIVAPLLALGEQSPLLSQSVTPVDAGTEAIRAVLPALAVAFLYPVAAGEILKASETDHTLADALSFIPRRSQLTPQTLRNWLQKHDGQVIDGLQLTIEKDAHTKNARYRVKPA